MGGVFPIKPQKESKFKKEPSSSHLEFPVLLFHFCVFIVDNAVVVSLSCLVIVVVNSFLFSVVISVSCLVLQLLLFWLLHYVLLVVASGFIILTVLVLVYVFVLVASVCIRHDDFVYIL